MTLGEDQAQANRELKAGASAVTQGVCESIDWATGLATVNVGGGSIRMPMAGVPPYVGGKVWVGYLGEQPLCVGPVSRPGAGTIQGSASGGKINVLADNGTVYNLGYLGTAPANTNRVLLDWRIGGTILGVLSAEPSAVTPDVPASPTTIEREYTFNPTDSGNWYNGASWANGLDPWESTNNQGAYFYGTTIADTIPDDAVFVPGSLQVYLANYYDAYPGQPNPMGLHALTGKSGAPNPTQTTAISNGSGWKPLPDTWEDELRLGTARGIAFVGGAPNGYRKYRRAGVDNSGVIVGKWLVSGV